MKSLTEQFTEEEYRKLKEGKGDRTWREAILEEIAGLQEVE